MVSIDTKEIQRIDWSEAVKIEELAPVRAVGKTETENALWQRVNKAASLVQPLTAKIPNLEQLLIDRFGKVGDVVDTIVNYRIPMGTSAMPKLGETCPELSEKLRRFYSRKINFYDFEESIFTSFNNVRDVFPRLEQEFFSNKFLLPPVGVVTSRFKAYCGAYREPLAGTVFIPVCIYVIKDFRSSRYGSDLKTYFMYRAVREWDADAKAMIGYMQRETYINTANLVMATSKALARPIQTAFETSLRR